MFTTQCLIKKNSKNLQNYLQKLGYTPLLTFNNSEDYKKFPYLFTENIENNGIPYPIYMSQLKETELMDVNTKVINCGTNEKLFISLVALRDDSDENQWFVLDINASLASENFKPKGTFILCKRKSWFRDLDKDGKPDLFSSRNIPAHKATVQELIDNQDIWQKSEKMGSVDEL